MLLVPNVLIYISDLRHYCKQILNEMPLEEGFILVHSWRGYCPSWSRKCGTGSVRQLATWHSQSEQRGMNTGVELIVSWFSLTMDGTTALRAGLPSSLKPLWKRPHRPVQRCISLLIPNSVRLHPHS